MDIFNKLYKKLNTEQKDAVDTIEGPVMVIAGPGTGKTTILTLRIANILKKTDTNPSSILALTFTDSAVSSMREKLLEIIGKDAYKINIYTFHGFCNATIKEYPEEFPRIIGSVNATAVDQVRILEDIIKETKFKHIKPFGEPFYYIKPALAQIQNLKRDGISSEDFKKNVSGKKSTQDKKALRNIELAKLYGLYEKKLREKKMYDFDDMILEVVSLLKKAKDFRLQLQEKYQYLLADEHQDANYAQNLLLEYLSSHYEQPNLFIVGDEKQAIFRFQGASLENFLFFKDRFKDAKVINLTGNYRSGQKILDGAHSLITAVKRNSDAGNIRVPLSSKLIDEDGVITVMEFERSDQEYFSVARGIKRNIKDGSVAVLYRDNKDAVGISDSLKKAGVDFVIESNQNILEDEDIQKLLLMLRAVENPSRDELLGKLMFLEFLSLPLVDIYQVIAGKEKGNAISKIISSKKILEEAGVSDTKPFLEFFAKLSLWNKLSHTKNFIEVLETVIKESGFLEYTLSLPDSAEKMEKLDRFFTEAEKVSYENLSDFLTYITLLLKYKLGIKSKSSYFPDGVARLMTSHTAKGKEFDYVYVIDVYDGHWGNRKLPVLFEDVVEEKDEDERRLFYVALTRAKKQVTFSFSRTGADGKSRLPSQFIDEIDEKFKEYIKIGSKESFSGLSRFNTRRSIKIALKEKKYLANRFEEQGLSITAINNYLLCPWKYFFVNLIRVPQSKNKFQRYGNAVHDTLSLYVKSVSAGKDGDATLCLDIYKDVLKNYVYGDYEYRELLEKGRRSFSGYIKERKKDFGGTFLLEHKIKTERAGVLLKGILDRFDVKSGEVVDYKTGKTKSRNWILGKTKDSTGDYFRQVVFYKLLGSDNNLDVKTCVIDFVEPNATGKYKRESFKIDKEDTDNMEKLITRVIREIKGLSFWNDRCNDKNCQYCFLASQIDGGK